MPRDTRAPHACRQMPVQAVRCFVIGHGPDEPADRFPIGHALATREARAQMLPNGRRRIGSDLAVEVRIEMLFQLEADHRARSIAAGEDLSTLDRRSRARARRDITVPIGTCTTAAISL